METQVSGSGGFNGGGGEGGNYQLIKHITDYLQYKHWGVLENVFIYMP